MRQAEPVAPSVDGEHLRENFFYPNQDLKAELERLQKWIEQNRSADFKLLEALARAS
jgi:hypothetical protein